MTRKRDPDIMAMARAIRAIQRSTPRALAGNVEYVKKIFDHMVRESEHAQAIGVTGMKRGRRA